MSRNLTGVQVLEEVGTALYGYRWQRPLADAISINERQLRRWLTSGRLDPHNAVFPRVLELLESQEKVLMLRRQALVRWLGGV